MTMRMAMKRVGDAAPGVPDPASRLLVMTYNVLAQCYVRSSFFPYCNGSALRWKNRSKKLEEVFSALPVRPDVICLQEVDQVDEFWAGMMERQGYVGLFVKKTSTKKDGVAMFYNDKRVKMLEQQPIALDDPAGDEADYSADLLDRSRRGSVALLTKFQRCDDASEVFVVATTHLFWDPTQEDVKLLQSRRLLHHLDAFASVHQPLHTILAGDFNSLPDSEVYRFIREHGRFGSAYEYYPRTTASDSVLAEPSYTNVNGADAGTDGKQVARFVGTLDYIFYRSESNVLRPVELLEILSFEEATKEVSLPSTFSPSDHLPLLSAFDVPPQGH